MAYGQKYRIGSKERGIQYEVRLLKKDYTGSVIGLKSPANAFTHEYQGRDDDLGFAIKKGMLEARFYARNQAEEDILNEFYGADEDEWRAKLYINGEHKWTGKVATNLFDVSDGPYPKSCEVVAKDLSSVDGKKIAKSNFRYGNLIETIAGIINGSTASGTGLSLPIHTYIGWEHEDLPAATDILQDLYYASYTPSFGSAPDTPFQVRGDRGAYIYVDLWKALTQILKRFNLTLFQWDGKWVIYQPGYLARHSDSVRRYEYDAGGDRVGTTAGINLEDDISDYLIKEPKGHERYRKALKSVGSTLNVDHYGSSERFDQSVKIEPSLPTSYEEITVRIYVPDYSTRMSFSFDVIGDWGQAGNNSAIARYAMWFETDGGDRVWLENDFNTAWDFVLNSAEDPLEVDLDNPENKKTFKKSVEVETSGFSYLKDSQMQAGFYADLTIRLYGTSSAGMNAPTLHWENFEYSVIEDDVTTTAESITNFLEQSQTFSPEKDLGEIIIGQHPYQNSDGNLMREAGGGRQVVAGYRPDGSDGIEDMERATLREVLSLHRTYRKEYNFVGLGTLDLFKVYNFRGTKYIMTGGMLRSRLSEWDLTFVELRWEDGSDDFYQNYDSSDGPRSSGVVAGSSESGSGVSQNAGDNRWLNESENGADIPDKGAFRSNIDVYSKDEAAEEFLSESDIEGRFYGREALYRTDEIDSFLALYIPERNLKDGSHHLDLKALDVQGRSTFFDEIQDDSFALTTDFSGTGWQGTGEGDFNIRNLTVREAARFRELIIDQLSVIAGSDLLSVARGKIKEISGNDIILENPNQREATTWKAGDFFWSKNIDIDGGAFTDIKGQVSGVDVTDGVITLTLDTSVTGATGSAGDLSEGDVLVQRGHPTDTDRQALIYRTVSDSDAPVEKYFTGIDSLAAFDEVSSVSTQLGVLDALTSTYSNVSGEGLFTSKAYLTDEVLVGDLDKQGHYLEYANGVMNLKGAFTITGGSGISNFTDAGALAGKNSVDLSSNEVTNKNTSSLSDDANLGKTADWESVSGDGKPTNNADVTGDQFNDDLDDIETGASHARAGLDNSGNVKRILKGANLTDGAIDAAGLYMTATNLGYHNGATWAAYIENDGSFFFRDAGGKGISFNGGEADFAIDVARFLLEAESDGAGLLVDSEQRLIAMTDGDNRPLQISPDLDLPDDPVHLGGGALAPSANPGTGYQVQEQGSTCQLSYSFTNDGQATERDGSWYDGSMTVEMAIEGQTGSGWEAIAEYSYTVRPGTLNIGPITISTVGYSRIRLHITNTESEPGAQPGATSGSIDEYRTTVGINNKGLFIGLAPGVVRKVGAEGDVIGSSNISTVSWSGISGKPSSVATWASETGFDDRYARASHSHGYSDLPMSQGDADNWSAAYGWGDHSKAGYLTSLPSHSHGYSDLPMSQQDASQWDSAYDHSQVTEGNPHGLDTGDVPEGENLYFTDQRARSAGGAYFYRKDEIDSFLALLVSKPSHPDSGGVGHWNGRYFATESDFTYDGDTLSTPNLYADRDIIIGEDTTAPAHGDYAREHLPNIHMGWLTGLPQYDKDGEPTGTRYSSNQYGIWLRPGDDIVVDGEYRQKGGSWLLEEDAAIRILSGTSGNDLIRLGRQDTLGRGLFFYDGQGQANDNVILQLVNSKFEIRKDFKISGTNGDYWEFGVGFQFGGTDGIMKGIDTYEGTAVTDKIVHGSDSIFFGDLDVQVDTNNYFTADSTGLDIAAQAFHLETPNLVINSAQEIIDIGGGTHFLNGANNEASFANGILTADETEVGLAGFTATSDLLTDGEVAIGSGISSATERLRIGMWEDDYVYMRVADSDGNSRIGIQSIGPNSESTPDTHRLFYQNPDDGIVVQFGQVNGVEDNRIAGMEFNHERMTNANGDFEVGTDGFSVAITNDFSAVRAFTMGDTSGEYGALYAVPDNAAYFVARGGLGININSDDFVNITSSSIISLFQDTYVGGDLHTQGDTSVSGTKQFLIDHPIPEKSNTHLLAHGAVETPNGGDNMYRYKVEATEDDESVLIKLPEYFKYLNENIDVFVTPDGHYGSGYGIVNANDLKVKCEKAGSYNVLVIGTRKDEQFNWKGVERLKDA